MSFLGGNGSHPLPDLTLLEEWWCWYWREEEGERPRSCWIRGMKVGMQAQIMRTLISVLEGRVSVLEPEWERERRE